MQVALDGPNVTLLFLKIYEQKRCLNQLPSLLDIGIWGFHTIQGSLKNSEKASECDIGKVLKSIYSQIVRLYIYSLIVYSLIVRLLEKWDNKRKNLNMP